MELHIRLQGRKGLADQLYQQLRASIDSGHLAAGTQLPPTRLLAARLMAYIGPAVTVADVVVHPSRSIIKQSYDARERRNDSSLPFHLVRLLGQREASAW